MGTKTVSIGNIINNPLANMHVQVFFLHEHIASSLGYTHKE